MRLFKGRKQDLQLLNVGCGTHYADGWLNVDVWENDETRPDLVVAANEPYPFADGTFDAIFLGHVVEHLDWHFVRTFLADMERIAKPGSPILIVAPDVYRTIDMWRDGGAPWELVQSVLEHQDIKSDNVKWAEFWDGATHHWNCHERRVVEVLESIGAKQIEVVSETIPDGDGFKDPHSSIVWPVVGKAQWQCAVRFVA